MIITDDYRHQLIGRFPTQRVDGRWVGVGPLEILSFEPHEDVRWGSCIAKMNSCCLCCLKSVWYKWRCKVRRSHRNGLHWLSKIRPWRQKRQKQRSWRHCRGFPCWWKALWRRRGIQGRGWNTGCSRQVADTYWTRWTPFSVCSPASYTL